MMTFNGPLSTALPIAAVRKRSGRATPRRHEASNGQRVAPSLSEACSAD